MKRARDEAWPQAESLADYPEDLIELGFAVEWTEYDSGPGCVYVLRVHPCIRLEYKYSDFTISGWSIDGIKIY